MSDLKFCEVRVGTAADYYASPGYKAWKRRQERRAEPSHGPGRSFESGLPHAHGAAGSRLAARRRDLVEMERALAHSSSPVVSLHVGQNGRYCAQARLAGCSVRMVVDTGATVCCLTEEDAKRAGIRLTPSDFTWKLSTQSGQVIGAPISFSTIQIGSIIVSNVEGVVTKSAPGSESLLGMSFLRRLREVSMENGCLVLRGTGMAKA